MLKYLVLILIALAIYWLFRGRGGAKAPEVAKRSIPPEKMLTCRHCGVRFPESESISAEGKHYCCEDHCRAGER